MNYIGLVRQYPRYLSFGFLHYFFSSPGQSFFISLFVPYWLVFLEIDNFQFGSIYSAATLLSALIIPWLGNLLDRMRLRLFSTALGIVYIAFCLSMAAMSHPVWLFVSLMGVRLCGQGLMVLTGSTAVARYFEANRGKALSLIGFGVSLGEFALPILVVALLGVISWQMSWVLVGISLAVFFLPAAWFLISSDDPFQLPPAFQKSNSMAQGASLGLSRKEVLRMPSFYLILGLLICIPFFYTGIVIHKNLLGQTNGWSELELAQALSVFGLTRLLSNIFVGPLIDRLSGVRIVSFVLIPTIIACAAFFFSSHIAVAYVLFFMCGLSSSLTSIAGTALLPELYGTSHLGSIKSMVSTVAVVATGLAPVIFGWALRDHSSQLWVMGISGAIMAALSIAGILTLGKLSKNA